MNVVIKCNEVVLRFVYWEIAIVFLTRTEVLHRTTSSPVMRSLSLLRFGPRELFA